MAEFEDIINLIQYGATLKRVNRTGWGIAGVDCIRPESVAEHSYGSILTSVLIAQHMAQKGVQLDVDKLLTMAIIHDLPESLTSDIPRTNSFNESSELKNMKQRLEREAIKKIFKKDGIVSKHFLSIWEEFKQESTIEAKIVRGADILDMLMHALILEDVGVSPQLLHQFFVSSHEIIESLEIDILFEIYLRFLKRHQNHAETASINIDN
jgi:putative hydrolase of HD superfamily